MTKHRKKPVVIEAVQIRDDNDDVNSRGMCNWCKKRPATLHFGDMFFFNPDGEKNCCKICCITMQLDHALERARVIPDLKKELDKLLDDEWKEKNAR